MEPNRVNTEEKKAEIAKSGFRISRAIAKALIIISLSMGVLSLSSCLVEDHEGWHHHWHHWHH